MSNKNYNQARIYKITCNLPTINEIYIGSTADYENRCISHRSDCHNVNHPNYGYKVYNYIRNNGGFGNFTIDVIEHYPCANKTAMRIREQYWMNEYQPTLNVRRAYQTAEDLKLQKQYHNDINNKKESHIQNLKKLIQCSNCSKFHTKGNTTQHKRSTYCKNYKSTASESTSESFIESDTDVE
jgi:uncharacterized protein YeaO (DUF488 family)